MSRDPLRHRHAVPSSAFGGDRFGLLAERFARSFGTPRFLLAQTFIVAVWIILNALALSLRWDPYPFILLNLVFSTQAAYAAPLILLAETRQADRERAGAAADAHHREELADAQMVVLERNRQLVTRVAELTEQIHDATCGHTRRDK